MADAMDSKSISRKGVGVRLPSLAPERESEGDDGRRARALAAAAEELAPVLFASLEGRLRATRCELEAALAALRADAARALRDERLLARQDELREDVRRAGWCLGVLGLAQGADLLRARREREGLRWLVAALAEARGLELEPPAAALPLLEGRPELTLEVAVLAAWCALRAGAVAGGRVRWSVARDGARTRLAFEVGPASGRAELAERCAFLGSTRPLAPEMTAPELTVADGRLALAWL